MFFGHIVGRFWLYFSLQKENGCAIKFLKEKLALIVKLGHLAMPCPFFKNHHLHPSFFLKKRRDNFSKLRIFQIVHLFSKLGEFSYALSPSSETNQVSHLFSKKKGKPFFSKQKKNKKNHHA